MSRQNPNRLYKNKRDGKLFGVCAGVADYFDINVAMVRVLTVVGSFVFPFAIPVAYVVAAMTLNDKPLEYYDNSEDYEINRRVRNSPNEMLKRTRHRFNDIDARLRRMERHVTSKEYQFDQELK